MHPLALPTLAATLALMTASPASAWGELGHRVVALIAYKHLSPTAKARIDAILSGDTDPLTPPDIGSRAVWDTQIVRTLGNPAEVIVDSLDREIAPADMKAWTRESFSVAKAAVYKLPVHGACDSQSQPVTLPEEYQMRAQRVVSKQLERGGLHLTFVLNEALQR
ncbi:MAG: hypothetical protein JSR45_14000 [Proteobacteria bacterium]|nr:hypothetical protein [Pseudomonadota bacterium]